MEDAILVDFLASLEDYVPTVPDELVEFYISTGGFGCPDSRITRLISVATQKFVADIANDALQYCKLRQNVNQQANKSKSVTSASTSSKISKEKRLALTSEDLAAVLRDYGVNLRRQDYYADSASAGTTITNPSAHKD